MLVPFLIMLREGLEAALLLALLPVICARLAVAPGCPLSG